jgi:alpha-glucosidase
MTIPLDFLPAGKMFEARIYSDDPTVSTRTKVGIQSVRVDSKSVLNAKLLPSGGQAIWIKPLR